MRKIVALFGVVRTVVVAVTLVSVGAFTVSLGAHPLVTASLVLGLTLVFWKAPFGAKYRRW